MEYVGSVHFVVITADVTTITITTTTITITSGGGRSSFISSMAIVMSIVVTRTIIIIMIHWRMVVGMMCGGSGSVGWYKRGGWS